ncbi:hypothetical protein IW261DRAFT_1429261 [Armillaria novae-zelandiae]|uniref:Uncharacterized protein n=1 Tax=Armillaria novae-zelandiae TaxID=153914 RepID=A0AA39KFM1_9AGAR|nr:hypothetical protein IW261DRAFT_1429261 [Armillaria novae-zelandiae]
MSQCGHLPCPEAQFSGTADQSARAEFAGFPRTMEGVLQIAPEDTAQPVTAAAEICISSPEVNKADAEDEDLNYDSYYNEVTASHLRCPTYLLGRVTLAGAVLLSDGVATYHDLEGNQGGHVLALSNICQDVKQGMEHQRAGLQMHSHQEYVSVLEILVRHNIWPSVDGVRWYMQPINIDSLPLCLVHGDDLVFSLRQCIVIHTIVSAEWGTFADLSLPTILPPPATVLTNSPTLFYMSQFLRAFSNEPGPFYAAHYALSPAVLPVALQLSTWHHSAFAAIVL